MPIATNALIGTYVPQEALEEATSKILGPSESLLGAIPGFPELASNSVAMPGGGLMLITDTRVIFWGRGPSPSAGGAGLLGMLAKRYKPFQAIQERLDQSIQQRLSQPTLSARQSLKDFYYRDIASVEDSHGILGGQIVLNVRGVLERFTNPMDKGEIALASNLIRGQLTSASKRETSSTPTDGSILEQIKKLAELREAGILTEEEFTGKKADLLRRL